jgi:hypothetical protein
MLRAIIGVLAAFVSMFSCTPYAGLPPDFARTDADVHGFGNGGAYIEQGSAFGVAIGMDRKASQAVMAKIKGVDAGDSSCDMPLVYNNEGVVYEDDPMIVNCVSKRWSDRYWFQGAFRTGNVEIKSRNGKVYRIEWGAPRGFIG